MIDAHAHHQQFPLEKSKQIVQLAIDAGIEKIALGGTHPADWKAQVQLHHYFQKNIFLHFGIHPWWVEKYTREEMGSFLEQLDQELPLVHGLGETGLDFYIEKRDPSRFEDQQWVMREQIRLAKKHSKPIVLHIVHAHPKALEILKNEKANEVPLVIHRFSGSFEVAQQYLALGAILSFHDAKPWMKEVPFSQMLLETDSNEKEHPGGWDIRPHYKKSAQIVGLSLDDFTEKMAENFAQISY